MSTRDYHERLWEVVPEGLAPAAFDARLRFLLARVSAGAKVLDVGCGEGRFAAALAGAGAEVVAVDVAEEPLRRARALHPQLDLRLIDPAGAWDLPDAGFDVVWAGEVIEHVADTASWLSEVRRVLRPCGRLLLSTPANGRFALLLCALWPAAFDRRFDPLGEDLRFYTRRTLAGLLLEFGFTEVRVRSAAGPPWARRLLLAEAIRRRF